MIKTKEAHGERDADLREHRAYCPGLTVHATAGSVGLQHRELYHNGDLTVNGLTKRNRHKKTNHRKEKEK